MKEKPVVGIATDGAHSAKERLTRFRAVDLSSGKELFSKAIGNWTNNIAMSLILASITLRNISAFCNAGHLREEAVCLLRYHVMAVMLSE